MKKAEPIFLVPDPPEKECKLWLAREKGFYFTGTGPRGGWSIFSISPEGEDQLRDILNQRESERQSAAPG